MLSHQKAQAINRYVKHRRYSIAFIDLVISLFLFGGFRFVEFIVLSLFNLFMTKMID